MSNLIANLDAQLARMFTEWNSWTTFLVMALFLILTYPLLYMLEPDTHPLLLSRQASISPVRQPGESAIYRSNEVPHGLSLRSGLDVKDAGQAKWTPGRDGDLRDIWRRIVSGPLSDAGQPRGQTAKIMTIFGQEELQQHEIASLSTQINVFGQYVKKQGGTAVAIYMPNSIELLLAVFAGAFYGFHPILLPYGQPQDVILKLINMSNADFLVASAGSLPLDDVKKQCGGVKEVMWYVAKTSRDVDWSEEGTSSWHELVEMHGPTAPSELPANNSNDAPPDLITVWLNKTATQGEIVAFTQSNITAAVAAQLSALPNKYKISTEDLFLPADSLTSPYVLTQTLAALFAGASLALNSVAGEDIDLGIACANIAPTIVAASAKSALKLHEASKLATQSSAKRIALRSQTSSLESGYMPPPSLMTTINAPARAKLGNLPNKLRLLYVYERVHSGTPPLGSDVLSELRAYTGARVIYALTAAKVAGCIAQTAFYDYRSSRMLKGRHSHFGPPLSSLEVKLLDTDTHKTVDDQDPMGEIVVSGPSVQHGKAHLDVLGTFRDDGTLAYI